jgi:hypothetical protein
MAGGTGRAGDQDPDRLAQDAEGSRGDPRVPSERDGEPSRTGRFTALGCLMTVAGFFSGAMVAVLIAKLRGWAIHCQPADAELPACNWEQFAGVGGLIGAVTLPALVFWRLLLPRRGNQQGEGEGDGGQDL